MESLTSHNYRNESQIVFTWDDSSKYSTVLEFYAHAVRLLWGQSESSIRIDTYVANAEEIKQDANFMRREIEESIGMTPIDGLQLDLRNMTECRTFRHDWNVKELVWRSNTMYWYMLWETTG